MSIHTSENRLKPFTCCYGLKSFVDKAALNSHVKKRNPHSCLTCSRKSSHLSSRRRHALNHCKKLSQLPDIAVTVCKQGDLLLFSMYFIFQHCFVFRLSDPLCRRMLLRLWHGQSDAPTTRLDLVHNLY